MRGGGNDHQFRTGQGLMDFLGHRHRRAGIVLADDDQAGTADFLQPRGKIDFRDGMAAADVARHGRAADHGRHILHHFRARLPERLGEPARQRGLDQRLHALGLDGLDALGPQAGGIGRIAAGGVAQSQAREHARVLERVGLAYHPAHGQADEVSRLYAQRLQQAMQVIGQQLQRIGACRRAAAAVAAGIEAQHLVMFRQALCFLVPHMQIAGEGMAQRNPGSFALDRGS